MAQFVEEKNRNQQERELPGPPRRAGARKKRNRHHQNHDGFPPARLFILHLGQLREHLGVLQSARVGCLDRVTHYLRLLFLDIGQRLEHAALQMKVAQHDVVALDGPSDIVRDPDWYDGLSHRFLREFLLVRSP